MVWRITTSPPNPLKGNVYFDDAKSTLRLYDGTDWQDVKHDANSGPIFIPEVQLINIFQGTNANYQTVYSSNYLPSYAKLVILKINGVAGCRKDSNGSNVIGTTTEGQQVIVPITNLGTFEFANNTNINGCTINLVGYF